MAILKRNRTVDTGQIAYRSETCEGGAGPEDFPRVNVFEEADSWVFTFEVPGVNPEDLALTVRNRLLTVEGKRSSFFEGKKSLIHRRESCIGECAFRRTLHLPADADADTIAAHVKHGMLFVTADKTAQPPETKIRIDRG